jgi:hypothetical protein
MEMIKIKMEIKNKVMIIKRIKNLKFYLNNFFNFINKLCGTNNFISSRKYAYIIPFIFTNLNPNVSTETDPLVSYAFSMFMLNLIILICFVNIVGYILSIYLVNKYDIEEKFPKFKRYINFYKTTSKF